MGEINVQESGKLKYFGLFFFLSPLISFFVCLLFVYFVTDNHTKEINEILSSLKKVPTANEAHLRELLTIQTSEIKERQNLILWVISSASIVISIAGYFLREQLLIRTKTQVKSQVEEELQSKEVTDKIDAIVKKTVIEIVERKITKFDSIAYKQNAYLEYNYDAEKGNGIDKYLSYLEQSLELEEDLWARTELAEGYILKNDFSTAQKHLQRVFSELPKTIPLSVETNLYAEILWTIIDLLNENDEKYSRVVGNVRDYNSSKFPPMIGSFDDLKKWWSIKKPTLNSKLPNAFISKVDSLLLLLPNE